MYWFEEETLVSEMEDWELDMAYEDLNKVLGWVLETKQELEARLKARQERGFITRR